MKGKFADYLLEQGIHAAELARAQARQKELGGRLDTAILEEDVLDEGALLTHFSAWAEIPIASRAMMQSPKPRAVALLDGKTALHQRVLPVSATEDTVTCVVTDAVHPAIMQILEATFNRKVSCHLTCDFRFHELLNQLHDHDLSERYAQLIERFPMDTDPFTEDALDLLDEEEPDLLDEEGTDDEGLMSWILDGEEPKPDAPAAETARATVSRPQLIVSSVEGSDASMVNWMMDDEEEVVEAQPEPQPTSPTSTSNIPQLIVSGVAGSDASMANWMMDDDEDDPLMGESEPQPEAEPAAAEPKRGLFFGGPKLGGRSPARPVKPVSDATFAAFMNDNEAEDAQEETPDPQDVETSGAQHIELLASGVAGSDASMANWMMDDDDDPLMGHDPMSEPAAGDVTQLELLEDPLEETPKDDFQRTSTIVDSGPIAEPPEMPDEGPPVVDEDEEKLIAWILEEGDALANAPTSTDEEPVHAPAWSVEPEQPVTPKHGLDEDDIIDESPAASDTSAGSNIPKLIVSGVAGSDASMANWMMDDDEDDPLMGEHEPQPEAEPAAAEPKRGLFFGGPKLGGRSSGRPVKPVSDATFASFMNDDEAEEDTSDKGQDVQLMTSGVAGSDASMAAWMMDDDDDPLSEPAPPKRPVPKLIVSGVAGSDASMANWMMDDDDDPLMGDDPLEEPPSDKKKS